MRRPPSHCSETTTGATPRRVQALRPDVAAAGLDVAQSDSNVERSSEHRVTDGAAPQHAGVGGLGVEMGEFADRAGGLHHCVFVVEIGEGNRRGAHQRTVTGRVAGALVQRGRLGARMCRRDRAVARGRAQHRAGLDAYVFGVERPLVPAGDDAVLRGNVTQVSPGRGDLCDRDRHRGVVGPLPGLPAAATAHGDLELGAAGLSELVWRAERVACRSA